MPLWVLTTAYTLHMGATAIWVGGILFQVLLLMPLAFNQAATTTPLELLDRVRQRFQPLAWLCLAVLTASGLMQMTANPNYDGFLTFDNRWSIAILAKHLAVAGMAALLAYQTWVLYPRWSRVRLLASGRELHEVGIEAPILRQEQRLVRAHLVLSVLILILTAVARTA